MPTPLFKPGHSGNPGGRPKLDPKTRKLIQSNGEIAVKRMNDLLSMDELFNRRLMRMVNLYRENSLAKNKLLCWP